MAEQFDARHTATSVGFDAGGGVYSLPIAGGLVVAGSARMGRPAGPPSASESPPQQPQS